MHLSFFYALILKAAVLWPQLTANMDINNNYGQYFVAQAGENWLSPMLDDPEQDMIDLYHELELDGELDFTIFEKAYKGFEAIEDRKKDVLTIVDFTKPSSEERFYVIDLQNRELLNRTYVAHGKNSGDLYAKEFSNIEGSYKSSLGFYLTTGTYKGKNGYSLQLEGLEEGINDNARQRAIVVHGSKYCGPAIVKRQGKIGRSLGCPALPMAETKQIIDRIKHGSVLFIYAESEDYLRNSPVLLKAEAPKPYLPTLPGAEPAPQFYASV